MQTEKTANAKAQHRKALTGSAMLLVVAILAGCFFAAILASFNALELKPAPDDAAWLNTALAWICLAGLSLALSGLMVSCLGCFLDSLAPWRGEPPSELLRSPLSAAPVWRNWADIRPPLFSN